MTTPDNNSDKIILILNEIKEKQNSVVVLSPEEIKLLKEIIADREALSRVFNWGKYILGGLSTIIIAWGVVSGEFLKWVKQGVGN